MTPCSSRAALRLSWIFLLVTAVSWAQETKHWNLPRFSADPKTIYEATSSIVSKKGTEVVVLYEEGRFTLDNNGKSTESIYRVYKIVSQNGVEDWDNLSAQWEPWHEEKPTLQARVITRDLVSHALDQKSITDSPASDGDSDVYGDMRVVRAPLPAVAPGAVVEEEETWKENAPLYAAGTVSRYGFGLGVPVQETRLVLDYPASIRLQYKKQLLPDVKEARSEKEGRVHLEFLQGPMDALESGESYLPSDQPVYPQVFFSTGESWQKIASSYAAIVDEQIAKGNATELWAQLAEGKKGSEEKIAATLQYLSKEVRYTGVEFDEAGIVPHPPAETLKNKYGDCKDKATLLVASLRAAGVPAYVALLRVGTREDVLPDLPGIGRFDHAIVYVPGPPAYWIDPTDEYARLGQLPTRDQGRLALIAQTESTALTPTPVSPSSENRLYEQREFYLAENGPARVVEISRPQGAFESGQRAAYTDTDDKDTRKTLTDYVKREYLADKLTKFERTDPKDFSQTFQLTIEASPARRGFTDLNSGIAAIRRETLFSYLPQELQQAKAEETKKKEDADEAPKKPRTADYQLGEAYIAEWEYKVVPPQGFRAKALPEKKTETLGPGIYTQEFSVDADGAVHGKVSFDTVKRQLTVAEAEEMRRKVVEMKNSEAVLLLFEPISQALMNEGRVKESFQAARDLIVQNPKQAVYHLQMANYLLQAGMGKAAREEGQKAVELEPKSALAQKTLAEILEYDLVGRKMRRGSDHAGAAKAFRTAQRLDPDDYEITANLAVLLEFNDEGERYGHGARLDEAIAEYRKLTDEQVQKLGFKNNLAFALFYSGNIAEARKEAEKLNPQLKAIIVAAEAITNSSQAGLAQARKMTSGEDELKATVKTAGDMTMKYRAYPQAADLLEAGASGNNSGSVMGLAAMLRKAKKREEIRFRDDPPGVVEKMFVEALDGKLTLEASKSISSRNAVKVMNRQDPEEIKKTLNEAKSVRGMFLQQGLPVDAMLDVILAVMQVTSEGDDINGYKISLQVPGETNNSEFVVKEEGHYKLLDSTEKPNSIGWEVLDRVEVNNLKGARLLLDWLREVQHVQGGDDTLAGRAFPRLWTKGKEGDVRQIKLAAAAILCQTKETAADGVAILEPALKEATNETEKLNISLSLLDGYSALDAYEKKYVLASELAREYPDSKRVFEDRVSALRGLGRLTEVNTLASEWLKKDTVDLAALRAVVDAGTDGGNYDQAVADTKKILAMGKGEAHEYNGLAWLSLHTGKTNGSDVEAATKAVQLSKSSAWALHTLGCAYAEVGKTKEAREVLIQAMDLLHLDEPDDNYWYAFGRIAEQYGERQTAVGDYLNVKKPKRAIEIPTSSYRLAQLRLAAMEKSATPAGH